eukprot:TRINITY_DN10482_c0_g1_i2.p2 TRINITY_DN10482_c0_g1~~TRINITY_DN10482_c0_g1_i2.p2  ORF type:complete len:114 (-),score=15.77 TRINITY_DN10482_c0_g1_i2:211-552(-)
MHQVVAIVGVSGLDTPEPEEVARHPSARGKDHVMVFVWHLQKLPARQGLDDDSVVVPEPVDNLPRTPRDMMGATMLNVELLTLLDQSIALSSNSLSEMVNSVRPFRQRSHPLG